MATIYRNIRVTFWEDPFIEGLDRQHVCFYLFLLTNSKTKQCGIYEISIRQICKSYIIEEKEALEMIAFFVKAGKIKYSPATNEIAIKNWPKHNSSDSPKIKKCIENELQFVKNPDLIKYLYDKNYIDTGSTELPLSSPEVLAPPAPEPKKFKVTSEKSLKLWETFWNTYNKKIGKPQCEKLFFGYSEEIQEQICAAVIPYVASTTLVELPPGAPFKPYRANPQTWLNAKRWTDEIPAIETQKTIANQNESEEINRSRQRIKELSESRDDTTTGQ